MRGKVRFKTAHLNDVNSSLWRAAQSIAQSAPSQMAPVVHGCKLPRCQEPIAEGTWQGQDVICFKAQNCACTKLGCLRQVREHRRGESLDERWLWWRRIEIEID